MFEHDHKIRQVGDASIGEQVSVTASFLALSRSFAVTESIVQRGDETRKTND